MGQRLPLGSERKILRGPFEALHRDCGAAPACGRRKSASWREAAMKRLLVLQLLLIGSVAGAAFAHEVRPAYLEVRQTGTETYDVLWKVPGRGEDLRFGVYVR